jgi:hypothetical protein
MGGRAAIEQLLGRALPTHRSERASDHARRWTSSAEEDGTAAGPLTGARARRWVDAPQSSDSSAGPYPHGHGGSRARSRERRLEIYPRSEWIHPQPVVAATGSPQKGESRNLSSSSKKTEIISFYFLLPRSRSTCLAWLN